MQLRGIYKITSPSGKVYIGQSKNIKQRLQGYKWMKCKSQILLYNSLKKYGYENHHIEIFLHNYVSETELDNLEINYIKEYNSFVGWNKKGLNLTTGGRKNFKFSEQATKRQSNSRRINRDAGNISNVKLTKENVSEIKRLIALNYEKRAIGKMFLVAETTIAEIFSGRNWKDVPDYILTNDDLPFILTPRKKLSVQEVNDIIDLLQNKTLSYKKIGKLFNVDAKTVHYYAIKNNLTRT